MASAGACEPGERRGKARKSVRTRNNIRVKNLTEGARTHKSISVSCARLEWRRLKANFCFEPSIHSLGGEVFEFWDAYMKVWPRDPNGQQVKVEVDGILFDLGRGGVISIEQLQIEQERLLEAANEDRFFEVVDGEVEARFARGESVVLVFCMHVKLKVELFQTTLPASAPIVHCYAGPRGIKASLQTVPDYVPEDRFLDLNRAAQCWIAKTMVEQGFVQTTHYEVGPDHCFRPGETVFFRGGRERFNQPLWVISPEEEPAFRRLGQSFLVKRSLRQGDRFVLVPAYHRGADCVIEEEELPRDVLERGAISTEAAQHFALDECLSAAVSVRGKPLACEPCDRYAEGGGGAIRVKAARREEHRSLHFLWYDNGDGTAALQSPDGYFVIMAATGALHATATERSQAARFSAEPTTGDPENEPCRLRCDGRRLYLGDTDELRCSLDGEEAAEAQEGEGEEAEEEGEEEEEEVAVELRLRLHVAHCDLCALRVENARAAIVGAPLVGEEEGVPWPRDTPDAAGRFPRPRDRDGQPVDARVPRYMDLRGTLGFNAAGLLHGQARERDTTDWWVECPLTRQSVMTPRSTLLFLERWRDEREQAALRRAVEAIQKESFCKTVPGAIEEQPGF